MRWIISTLLPPPTPPSLYLLLLRRPSSCWTSIYSDASGISSVVTLPPSVPYFNWHPTSRADVGDSGRLAAHALQYAPSPAEMNNISGYGYWVIIPTSPSFSTTTPPVPVAQLSANQHFAGLLATALSHISLSTYFHPLTPDRTFASVQGPYCPNAAGGFDMCHKGHGYGLMHGPHIMEEWFVSSATQTGPEELQQWRRPFKRARAVPLNVWLMAQPVVYNDMHLWVTDSGVYTAPLYRLAGMYAPANGEFSTRVFPIPSGGVGALWLNIEATWKGNLVTGGCDEGCAAYAMVALLDAASNRVVPGFERGRCWSGGWARRDVQACACGCGVWRCEG